MKTEKILPRLDSIDVLRGIVMVVMALDHARDFFRTQWSCLIRWFAGLKKRRKEVWLSYL